MQREIKEINCNSISLIFFPEILVASPALKPERFIGDSVTNVIATSEKDRPRYLINLFHSRFIASVQERLYSLDYACRASASRTHCIEVPFPPIKMDLAELVRSRASLSASIIKHLPLHWQQISINKGKLSLRRASGESIVAGHRKTLNARNA